jgi:Putative NADP-dependent oxidoreductases
MPRNTQILLASRPQGEATVDNFQLVVTETPPLQEGQVLVRHHYLSLDPYMRGRMNAGKSYAPPQPLGEVMIGATVGEVVESRHPDYAVGDQVVGMGGWQEYSVVDARQPACCARSIRAREPVGLWASIARMRPSEASFCRIRCPIVVLWGKKTVKNGPLRRIRSRRFQSPTGSQCRCRTTSAPWACRASRPGTVS